MHNYFWPIRPTQNAIHTSVTTEQTTKRQTDRQTSIKRVCLHVCPLFLCITQKDHIGNLASCQTYMDKQQKQKINLRGGECEERGGTLIGQK